MSPFLHSCHTNTQVSKSENNHGRVYHACKRDCTRFKFSWCTMPCKSKEVQHAARIHSMDSRTLRPPSPSPPHPLLHTSLLVGGVDTHPHQAKMERDAEEERVALAM